MEINTFGQNKLSFGVGMPFDNRLTVATLKQRIRPNVGLPPNTTDVHDLLFKKILGANGAQRLKIFFHSIKSGATAKYLKKALSNVNLKRIFWETCDRFFDVQLIKPGDISRDDDERHIPDDDELKAIFPAERASRIDTNDDIKKFIDYYVESKQKGENLNRAQMLASFFKRYSKKIKISIGTLKNYLIAIKMIKDHLNESTGTEENFRQYMRNKYNVTSYAIYKNSELFSYVVGRLRELKQTGAEIESFSYGDVKTTNTKKFIDYYCSCYFEAKQKGKKLYEIKIVDSFLETSSKKVNVTKGTLIGYKSAINKIKNHLYESIGKTDEEFRQYIVEKYTGVDYTIIQNKELFSYAVGQLKELKQKMAEIEIAPVPKETRQTATGEIERAPYEEVALNNQRNEDGNSDRFKPQNVEDLGLLLDNFVDSQVLEENGMFSDSLQPKRVDDQELLVDLLYPQSSDVLELFPNSFVDSQVLEEHEMFSDKFPQQSFKDLGLPGDKFVDSQVLEEHGMFSDRFNLPNLEDFEFGLNSSQLPDTNSFANDNKLNLSRFHEFYDEAYSDKRRKM